MTDTAEHPTKTNSDSGARPFATIDPSTGETLREYPVLESERVVGVIEAAHAAFLEWRTRPVEDRAAVVRRAGELMLERRDDLADLLTLEMGKLVTESRFEVELAASILTYYGDKGPTFLQPEQLKVDEGKRRSSTRRSACCSASSPGTSRSTRWCALHLGMFEITNRKLIRTLPPHATKGQVAG